jgi:lysophospholipase L1-like esterase
MLREATTAAATVPSARKLGLLMVLGTIAAVLLLLAAAEVAVRVRQYLKYGSTATLEEQFTVDPAIRLRIPVAGYSRGPVSVNRLGFRGDEIAVPKPANTIRVAFLGASTTWCAEVSSNERVWAYLVTAQLREAFPRKQIDYINAGVPGYTMESILASLKNRVAPLGPDIVVIYEASNNLTGEMRRLAAQRGIVADDQFRDLSWPSRYSLLWHLVEKNLKLLAAERIAQNPTARLEVDARTLGEHYRAVLTEVVREAQRHAKVVALATFSIQPRREQTQQQKMQASSSALYYMPFLHPDTVIAAFERYNEIAREVARDTGALLIEGERDIPGDAAHFHDTVHFTDAGSAAMAGRVGRALIASDAVRAVVGQQ